MNNVIQQSVQVGDGLPLPREIYGKSILNLHEPEMTEEDWQKSQKSFAAMLAGRTIRFLPSEDKYAGTFQTVRYK